MRPKDQDIKLFSLILILYGDGQMYAIPIYLSCACLKQTLLVWNALFSHVKKHTVRDDSQIQSVIVVIFLIMFGVRMNVLLIVKVKFFFSFLIVIIQVSLMMMTIEPKTFEDRKMNKP